MAKAKAEDQISEDGGQPEADGLVTVVAVERVHRRAENRTYEPGETVVLEAETAALLVGLGVVRPSGETVTASTGSASTGSADG